MFKGIPVNIAIVEAEIIYYVNAMFEYDLGFFTVCMDWFEEKTWS